MAMNRIEGVKLTIDNLNKAIEGIQGRTWGGLLAAGAKVQRLSQQRVPVEYGNLRASAYARRMQQSHAKDEMAVEVGYTAAYALFVHENMQQKFKGQPRPSGLGYYWGPHGQPKFLESALLDLQQEIVQTIASRARIRE